MSAANGTPRRVAIVGGGAAGALAAIHLARQRGAGELEIELIDREGSFGPGIAYRTADPLHLLNVAACRMGAIADHPEHFHEWLLDRGGAEDKAAFVPRGVYGEYLRDLLAEAEGAVPVRRRRGEAVALAAAEGGAAPPDTEAPLELVLADGERLLADDVVLALGPLPGAAPFAVPDGLAEGVYVADPWAPGALDGIGAGDSVLIVGTGLTMVDVALTLCRGERRPALRAVSRHGLMPRAHRRELTRLRTFPIPIESGELDPVLAAVFEQITWVGQQGGDWRDVIDSMRPAAPALWRRLRSEEKRRFLTGIHRLWDVHRFRMAPEVAERFAALRAGGSLQLEAAAVAALEPRPGGGARVTLRTEAGEAPPLEVDRVVNCAGAGTDVTSRPPALLASLFEAGLARPDELALGLDVAPDGALVDAAGRPSARIHVLGALRKGVEWETIGITEIRDQAGTIAGRVAAHRAAPPRLTLPVPRPAPVGEAA